MFVLKALTLPAPRPQEATLRTAPVPYHAGKLEPGQPTNYTYTFTFVIDPVSKKVVTGVNLVLKIYEAATPVYEAARDLMIAFDSTFRQSMSELRAKRTAVISWYKQHFVYRPAQFAAALVKIAALRDYQTRRNQLRKIQAEFAEQAAKDAVVASSVRVPRSWIRLAQALA